MGLRSNPKMIELFAKAARDVWGHWEGWYSDQLHVYANLTEEIKVHSFTEQEHSLKNDKDTIVMSHHSDGHEDLKNICKEIGAL